MLLVFQCFRIFVALAVPLSFVVGVAQARQIWTGRNAEYQVDWTDHDITAIRLRDGRPVFSMHAFGAAQLDVSMRQVTSAAGTLTRKRKVSVTSLFGPLLALRDDTFDNFRPAAHPSERERFWTIDLSATAHDGFDPSDQFGAALGERERGRIQSLEQLVPAQAIGDVLAQDKVVHADVSDPPRQLGELLTTWRNQAGNAYAAALAGRDADAKGNQAPCYAVPEDVLTSFAIIGYHDDQIAVRLGLPGVGACHSEFTQLGLTLPLAGRLAQIVQSGAAVITPPVGLHPLEITVVRRLR